MNNQIIEEGVDIRAKLEQVAEECGELTKACMKLVRALGNGNPCNVSKEEAVADVLEEWSDVEVAGIYLLQMLEGMCDYDIYERIDRIGAEKTARWIERVKKEEANADKDMDDRHGHACADGDACDL